MPVTEPLLERPDLSSVSDDFVTTHDAIRRETRRLVACLTWLEAGPSNNPGEAAALMRWFDRLQTVIEQHHQWEDEVVWPAIESLVGEALFADDHRQLEESMGEARAALASVTDPDTHGAAVTAVQRFELDLDAHFKREELVVLPMLREHGTRKRFTSHGRPGAAPLAGATPSLIESIAAIEDNLPGPLRAANQWLLQPRSRRTSPSLPAALIAGRSI